MGLDKLCEELKKWGVVFQDTKHLRHVCMHPSFGPSSFERYEFLGDRVVNLVVGSELAALTSLKCEGELSKQSSVWVNGHTLALVAEKLSLDQLIQYRGDIKRKTLLADGFEALCGAIYLDQGLDAVVRFWKQVRRDIKPCAVSNKTKLQEWAHRHSQVPVYNCQRVGGTDHRPEFVATVVIGRLSAKGSGCSKKEAENNAADEFIKLHNV